MDNIKTLTELFMSRFDLPDRSYLRFVKKRVLDSIPAELQEMSLKDVLTAIENTKGQKATSKKQ